MILGDVGDATLDVAEDARLQVGSGGWLLGGVFTLGAGCSLTIGDRCYLPRLEIYAQCGTEIIIGDDASFTWATRIYAHERARIVIGKDCLIASDTLIMASDVHKIVDIATGERLNPPADILIGDHVWLAEGVKVYKGASIGSGSVVGAYSVVTGAIPENSVAAGTPARVLRQGVRWEK